MSDFTLSPPLSWQQFYVMPPPLVFHPPLLIIIAQSLKIFAHSIILQPILAARKTVIHSSRANLSLNLLSFFLQNDSLLFSLTSTFHLCISLVYFTVRRGGLLNLPKLYRASSVSWRAPTGKW